MANYDQTYAEAVDVISDSFEALGVFVSSTSSGIDGLAPGAGSPPIPLALIAPYCAWLVLELKIPTTASTIEVQSLIADLAKKSRGFRDWTVVNSGLEGLRESDLGGVQWDGAVFELRRRPAWAQADGPWEERDYNLVLTGCRGRFVMVYGPGGLLDAIRTAVSNNRLSRYRLLSSRILERAFLHGDARLVYLGAAHKRRRTKADAKALTGMAVQDALDPGADSSYFLRASRVSASDWLAPDEVIGVSLSKSSVWVRPAQNWNDHLLLAERVLDRIEERAGQVTLPSAFPFLCEEQASLDGVKGPYEFHSEPSISLSANDDEDLFRDASILDEAQFMAVPATNDVDVKLNVIWKGEEVLACLARFALVEESGLIKMTLEDERLSGSPHATKVRDALRRRELLSVHFASGHTWSGDRVYQSKLPDVRFPNWVWADFSDFEVTREKPGVNFDSSLIATHGDRSLFSWVVQQFGSDGILTCDDGAGEIGDFIKIDVERDQVTIIHVKGANSDSVGRGVATTAYEVVTAQATKNLARGSVPTLVESLKLRPNGATWIGGTRDDASRKMAYEWLEQMDQGTPIDVAIVQPHLTRRAYDLALKSSGAESMRLRLLETLLISARSEVTARAGDLSVYVSA